jgi:hypothetical protein
MEFLMFWLEREERTGAESVREKWATLRNTRRQINRVLMPPATASSRRRLRGLHRLTI